MKRRDFMLGVSSAALGVTILPAWAKKPEASTSDDSAVLKGFIVSDAHFGWVNEDQPAPDEQQRLIHHIARRFPDLDVFIDTGDAHHNGRDRDKERGQWTDIIPGGCPPCAFFYVAGNHEITHCGEHDLETVCNRMGSVACRPYYSFDLKGIHFISLPELMRAVYMNRETLEWLALDMEVHKDKTMILLSHNNIRGTTEDQGAYDYRSLVNSDELMALFEKYPSVIAWMHGHHHTYEIVEKADKLFVSNGRIGGFDPTGWDGEFGQGNLGGIYFEVRPEGLTVRCYSAEKEKFIDELGRDAVFTKTLPVKTSLDGTAPAAHCFGYGGARDGQRTPVYHHHTMQQGSSRLYVSGTGRADFNDDPAFELYVSRETDKKQKRALMAASLPGGGKVWKWIDPGIRIQAQEDSSEAIPVTVPLSGHDQHTYYRCAPGKTYRATLEVVAHGGAQQLGLVFRVHDPEGKVLASIDSPARTLDKGRQVIEATCDVPSFDDQATIYTRADSDRGVHISVEATLKNLAEPVDLIRLELALAGAQGMTKDAKVIADGKTLSFPGGFEANRIRSEAMENPSSWRDVFQVNAKGSGRVNWLVRQEGLDWQVRNAPVADRGTFLEIGPLRNTYTHRREIVIVPMKRSDDPFVHRLRNTNGAKVYPLNRGNDHIKIEIASGDAPLEIDMISPARPDRVSGTEDWTYSDGKIAMTANAGSTIEVFFG